MYLGAARSFILFMDKRPITRHLTLSMMSSSGKWPHLLGSLSARYLPTVFSISNESIKGSSTGFFSPNFCHFVAILCLFGFFLQLQIPNTIKNLKCCCKSCRFSETISICHYILKLTATYYPQHSTSRSSFPTNFFVNRIIKKSILPEYLWNVFPAPVLKNILTCSSSELEKAFTFTKSMVDHIDNREEVLGIFYQCPEKLIIMPGLEVGWFKEPNASCLILICINPDVNICS